MSTKHKEKAGSLIIGPMGFAPASGSSYTASVGDTHTGTVTAASIYGVWLYVNGVQQSWFGGSQSTTSLSLTYTFASDASGSYTMMARVYPWSGSTYGNYTDYSYTVTVGSTTPTTDDDDDTYTYTDDNDDTDTDDDTSDTDTDDDESSTASTSPYSLSASSTGSPFSPGDTVTLTLSGYESYYSVDWQLDSPQYSGTINLSSDTADGYGSYDSSVTYTFPSGYPGDYVFTVIVYTSGNMTRYEHTYTVTLGY